jgi:hypothetical protein
MKRALRVAVILILVMAAASCTTFKLSGIQITKAIPSYQTVGEFEISVSVMEFLGSAGGMNLANMTADAMDTKIYDAIQREISKFTGDAAVNVTVEYEVTLINAIVNGLTGAILAPATAQVSGVIVKYQ